MWPQLAGVLPGAIGSELGWADLHAKILCNLTNQPCLSQHVPRAWKLVLQVLCVYKQLYVLLPCVLDMVQGACALCLRTHVCTCASKHGHLKNTLPPAPTTWANRKSEDKRQERLTFCYRHARCQLWKRDPSVSSADSSALSHLPPGFWKGPSQRASSLLPSSQETFQFPQAQAPPLRQRTTPERPLILRTVMMTRTLALAWLPQALLQIRTLLPH